MKTKIFQSLIFSLLITVIIVWVVIGLGILRPLKQKDAKVERHRSDHCFRDRKNRIFRKDEPWNLKKN